MKRKVSPKKAAAAKPAAPGTPTRRSVAPATNPHSTDVFEQLAVHRHEQVSYWYDPQSGYRGVIAIHNTALGPALGGTRFWNYVSDAEALNDVLRLSRGMTYKSAVAGLNLGGGKSVIIGDPSIDNNERESVFRAHGRHVDALGGRYVTAEDVNTSPRDMEWVFAETKSVVGLQGRSGDPSPVTAFGTFRATQACAQFLWGTDDVSGKTVAVQGVGHVGYYLCKLFHEAGAQLIVSDVSAERTKRVADEFGARVVARDAIYGVRADVFAPCALGAIINDDTIKVLRAAIVCGAANNQLAEERHGDALQRRGIVYAPDYVANAGGLINVNAEIEGWSLEQSHTKAGEIFDTVLRVLEIARDEGIPSYRAADRLAEERVAAAERDKRLPHRI
ncbi:MAG: leucine dehydrogenase [Gemmatimonadota bacterium]|nr:leucine dehydrogenase [Gemmatimonadota bacterium]MDH5198615.1 leucine dehydrogenase [Gemmatimonadota bacterium]